MGTPYRECPNCGAHLDAGELCDCRRSEREPRRPEQEPRKPMRLMAICREIDKDTGRIAVYPLKMEIDDRILGALKVRATMNPELRYFVLVSARWEKYGTVRASKGIRTAVHLRAVIPERKLGRILGASQRTEVA